LIDDDTVNNAAKCCAHLAIAARGENVAMTRHSLWGTTENRPHEDSSNQDDKAYQRDHQGPGKRFIGFVDGSGRVCRGINSHT
jgi:hypothetical protein